MLTALSGSRERQAARLPARSALDRCKERRHWCGGPQGAAAPLGPDLPVASAYPRNFVHLSSPCAGWTEISVTSKCPARSTSGVPPVLTAFRWTSNLRRKSRESCDYLPHSKWFVAVRTE